MAKLLIKKKGYVAHRRGRPIPVRPTQYLAKDRGKKGRGKPFLKKSEVKKNILGEGFFDKPLAQEKAIVVKQAKRKGEKAVQGQLQYVANVQKRTNPAVAGKAKRLRKFVAGSMKGKKKVPYPKGM